MVVVRGSQDTRSAGIAPSDVVSQLTDKRVQDNAKGYPANRWRSGSISSTSAERPRDRRSAAASRGHSRFRHCGEDPRAEFPAHLNITSKIARAAGPLGEHVVIEVGPGPGGLTRALAHGAGHVIAIERDSCCIAALQMVVEAYPGRLTLVEADAARFDPVPLLAGRCAKIVANLPYNIGTQLLIGWASEALGPSMTA